MHVYIVFSSLYFRTAYQNFGKFDRIAQREFSKHTVAIDQLAHDLDLLVSTSVHPRILMQLKDTPSATTLDAFIPIDLMEQQQQQYATIKRQYDTLAQATKAQRNKVDYLTQQTAQMGGTNRTASEMIVAKVEIMASESAQTMRALVVGCQKKMGSKQPGRTRDACTSMYRYQHILSEAERAISQQRQQALQNFVLCMQHISKVEESVTHIYPTLADLEKQMKALRLAIEKHTASAIGNLPRRVVLGYVQC